MASSSKFKSVSVPKKEDVEEFDDIDAFLRTEASELTRETEMKRVLNCFKLNPYEVLEIPLSTIRDNPDGIAALIRKNYRTKSLLLHPDKLRHVDGPRAFDMLKKAEADLQDKDKKQYVDQIIIDARMLVLRGLDPPLKADTPDSYHALRNLRDPSLQDRIRRKAKELLVDEELRKRRSNKLQMIAEGSEAKRKDDEVDAVRKKREADKAWESSREERVKDWRGFQQHGGKRRKAAYKPLG